MTTIGQLLTAIQGTKKVVAELANEHLPVAGSLLLPPSPPPLRHRLVKVFELASEQSCDSSCIPGLHLRTQPLAACVRPEEHLMPLARLLRQPPKLKSREYQMRRNLFSESEVVCAAVMKQS